LSADLERLKLHHDDVAAAEEFPDRVRDD